MPSCIKLVTPCWYFNDGGTHWCIGFLREGRTEKKPPVIPIADVMSPLVRYGRKPLACLHEDGFPTKLLKEGTRVFVSR